MSEGGEDDICEIINQTMLDVVAIRKQGEASLERIEKVIARLMDGYSQILVVIAPVDEPKP